MEDMQKAMTKVPAGNKNCENYLANAMALMKIPDAAFCEKLVEASWKDDCVKRAEGTLVWPKVEVKDTGAVYLAGAALAALSLSLF